MSELNAKIIQYFKSCYQADARDLQLMNFFGSKILNAKILNDADLISGKNLLYPIDTEYGQQLDTHLSIHKKEKGLYAFSLFLKGKYNIIGKTRNVIAPLIIHPLELQCIDKVYYLSIKEGHHIFNPFFFNLSNTEGDSIAAKEELYQKLNTNFIQFDDCVFLSDIINKYFPSIKTTHLLKYPSLLSEKEIKKIINNTDDNELNLIPAAGIGIMKKSFSNRGIHEELNEMISKSNLSRPIELLFQTRTIKNRIENNKNDLVYAPVSLSHSQAEICRNANTENLSVVIGPPGTGKSFTIAAMACNAIAHGKTVLIASKNNQAVNVIADKLEQEMHLPNLAVRAGRKDYLKKLKENINDLFYHQQYKFTKDTLSTRKRILDNHKKILALEKEILKREKNEINNGEFLENLDQWFYKWKKKLLEYKTNKTVPLDTLLSNYFQLLETRNIHTKHVLNEWITNTKIKVLEYGKNDLRVFKKAVTARQGSKRDQLFRTIDLQSILKAFPVWLVNFQDIHKVIPLQEELFDLVIIDEASQCDIASSLPILQRGKKAVIVGDPKQLRHISFLSSTEQLNLKKKLNLHEIPENLLDYRNTSLLDLVLESQIHSNQIQSLNEHYRSQPDIIKFSNQTFYHSHLNIMTSCPTSEKNRNIFIHTLEGKRNKNGANPIEANSIIEKIKLIIQHDEGLEKPLCQTIGILSPFRGQVNFIQKRIEKEFPLYIIERHKILIGTPHSFQGEEKDIMFLSFTIDANTNSNVLRYLEKPDVFNVSITRAKIEQHIYISCHKQDFKNRGLLFRYLDQIEEERKERPIKNTSTLRDVFMDEILKELHKRDLDKILVHHKVASLDLDIVIVNNGKTKAIDLVGFPGAYQGVYHLEYYRMLSRIGIEIFPISYSRWKFQEKEVINRLEKFIQ